MFEEIFGDFIYLINGGRKHGKRQSLTGIKVGYVGTQTK
jgi:hypothetical protein